MPDVVIPSSLISWVLMSVNARSMRYFVGYLVEGEAAEYYKKITTELADKFGIKNLSLTKPPHFTLKAPFESDAIAPLEDKIKQVISELKSIPFVISDFGRFEQGSKSIYLEPLKNSELYQAAQLISNEVAWFGDKRLELPKPLVLHASIARYLEPEISGQVWSYLEQIPKPDLNLNFDNVTIFRYENGFWISDSIFRF